MEIRINQLLDKYWDGTTTVEEDAELVQYFQNGNVTDEHEPYRDLFEWIYSTQQITAPVTTDIDSLLEQYWDGTTTQKEEQLIKAYYRSGHVKEEHLPYVDLFAFYDDQLNTTYSAPVIPIEGKVDSEEKNTVKKSNVIPFVVRVAAIAVFVLSGVFIIRNMTSQTTEPQFASNVYVVEDPEEAMRITKEALALVSTKFRESQEPLKDDFANIELMNIFKSE